VLDDEAEVASCTCEGGPIVRGLWGGDSILDDDDEVRYAAKLNGGGRWNWPLERLMLVVMERTWADWASCEENVKLGDVGVDPGFSKSARRHDWEQ
jgi:hypothetical protein